jgi:hypothetical protein
MILKSNAIFLEKNLQKAIDTKQLVKEPNFVHVNIDAGTSPKHQQSSFTFDHSKGLHSNVLTGTMNSEREKNPQQIE